MKGQTRICDRCEEEKLHHAKGYCEACYKQVFKKPSTRLPRHFIPEKGDPHIRWLFLEMRQAGVTVAELSRKSGFSPDAIACLRRHGNARYLTFKTLIEALGYEIMIVAKEPANAPQSLVD